jgi:hypothetical protein
VVKNETGEIAIKITTTYYAGSFQTVEAQKKLNNFLGCKKDKIAIFPFSFICTIQPVLFYSCNKIE